MSGRHVRHADLSLYLQSELSAALRSSPAPTVSLSLSRRPPSPSPTAGGAAATPPCSTHPSQDPRWSAAVFCRPARSRPPPHRQSTERRKSSQLRCLNCLKLRRSEEIWIQSRGCGLWGHSRRLRKTKTPDWTVNKPTSSQY